MREMEKWLQAATRGLAVESAERVGNEIREHVEFASEEFVARGVAQAEANRLAVEGLGSARLANKEYRRVLLTEGDARILRRSAADAELFCRRSWLRGLVAVAAVAGLVAAVGFWMFGQVKNAESLLLIEVGMSPLVAAVFLRISTPVQGWIFRVWKWVAMPMAFVLLLGPNASKFLWLLAISMWPMLHSEIQRATIRRKLPAGKCPRHLYI